METETPLYPTIEQHKETTEYHAHRQAALRDNFETYMELCESGAIDSGLYPYQQPAFKDLLSFLRQETIDPLYDSNDPIDLLTKGGYMDLPTSYGKTVLIAKMLQAFGIGKLLQQNDARPLRALVLTNSSNAVTQTAGPKDLKKGLRHFAPAIKTTTYYGENKDLTGDVVVMTYASFRQSDVQEMLRQQDFDIIISDEAHHTLGDRTQEVFNEFRRGRLAISLTATPEYDPQRSLKNLLRYCIHKSEFRPLIESGNLSGIQLFGLATDCEIDAPVSSRQIDFTNSNLESLLYNDSRNQAIADAALFCMSEGRRGIINCIAGNNNYHGRLIAAMLDGKEITTVDANGTTINKKIRAAAVGNGIKNSSKILDDFQHGLYDVITQVRLIEEEWDSDQVSFMINAAPTLSLVRATQRFGRAMRFNKDWPVTIVIEFLDRMRTKRNPVTAWHVIGEESMEQGVVIAPPDLVSRKLGRKAAGGGRGGGGPRSRRLIIHPKDLPSDLAAMSKEYTTKYIKEFLLRAQEKIGPPPPDSIPLNNVMGIPNVVKSGIGIDGIRTILHNNDFPIRLAASGEPTHKGRSLYYVHKNAETFLTAYEFPERAPKDYQSCSDIAQELAVSEDTVDSALKRLNLKGKGKEFLSRRNNRKVEFFDTKQSKTIKNDIRTRQNELEPPKSGEVSLVTLAAELNEHRGTVRYFLMMHHKINGVRREIETSRHGGIFYTKEEADIARWHFSHIPIPAGKMTLEQIQVKAPQMEEPQLIELIKKYKADNRFTKGRHADASGRYHYTIFCDTELGMQLAALAKSVHQEVLEGLNIQQKRPDGIPETAVPLYDCLREARCDPLAMRYIFNTLPHDRSSVITASDSSLWLHPALKRRFIFECEKIPTAPSHFRSVHQLAQKYNKSPQEIHRIVTKDIMPNQKHLGLYRTNDETQIITIHYVPALADKIESLLRRR